jgi:hypothetical protein
MDPDPSWRRCAPLTPCLDSFFVPTYRAGRCLAARA